MKIRIKVADFASRLCNSSFSEDSIIRAIRQKPGEEADVEFKNDWSSYAPIAEAIKDENPRLVVSEFEKLSGIKTIQDAIQEELYEYLVKDQNYWDVRKQLLDKPRTVNFLGKHLDVMKKI